LIDINKNRPLSPHITVHKWILSQIMSILHRISAIGFSVGLLFISLWLISLSLDSEFYLIFKLIFFNFIGKIILIIISFCFSFYFFEEFRRLFWALGIGLSINKIKLTSYLLIFFSLINVFLIFLLL